MNTKRERRLVLLKYREFKISKRCLGKYLKESKCGSGSHKGPSLISGYKKSKVHHKLKEVNKGKSEEH